MHMARLAPTLNQDTEIDFKAIKERFFAINKARLARTMTDLRQRQRDFIELLPLLFHINHPIMPGYVSKSTPAGIPDYSPTNTTLNLAAKIAKSFSYKRRAYRRYHIEAIYMMGSTGTIAYSNKSDFDIWICYDDALKPDQIAALQQKAQAI
jgi:adenylate cyclase class 1